MERVADALGAAPDETRNGSRAVNAVRKILADLNFPVLSSIGVTADDIELLSDNALDDYFITQSPRPWTKAEVVEAFTAALNLESRSA
jgi:alcohol dehydrogenase